MKAKPIEPGCLALYVGYVHPRWVPYFSNPVRVGEKGMSRQGKEAWALPEMRLNGYAAAAEEKDLIRIDDPEIQSEIESERELEVTK